MKRSPERSRVEEIRRLQVHDVNVDKQSRFGGIHLKIGLLSTAMARLMIFF